VRKRGKSRSSSATKRAERYRRKYTVDATAKRAKVLLFSWSEQMREKLQQLDELELIAFEAFQECGVETSLYDYYMAWVKRKYQLGLGMGETTKAEEDIILQDEFVQRGLELQKLVCIKPFIEQRVSEHRGELMPRVQAVVRAWEAFDSTPTLDISVGVS